MVQHRAPADGVLGSASYEAVDDEGRPVPGPWVAVIARTHGNEPVGDPVLERLAQEADERLVAGGIVTIRANLLAAELGERHTVDGTDLNRLWDAETLARLATQPVEALGYEERRAREIAPLLLRCDAVLDLHSTSRPTEPFLVFRDDQRHAALAHRLGVRRLITGLHENGILSGGVASNVGLKAGEMGPRLGFTFEAGQHEDPGNPGRAWSVTERLLEELGVFEPRRSECHRVQGQVYEVVDRFQQAPSATPQFRFVGYEGGEGGGRRTGAPRKLHSFEEIEADEVVLRRGRNEVVRAQSPFTMLMPAPTTAPGTDLYYVTQPRHGGLSEGVPRTDAEARREGQAIERMLDLLADDEFERGSTWVAFDPQRLFDLCASIIGRSLRLGDDHPHRKLVVMGRGESVRDETERRVGQRYRQAMRAAITEGVPVERVQLLRGAPLSWIDAMTSHGMRGLLDQRAKRFGRDYPGVRMRVSTRQPHTASLLVAGDLEHAMREGETRHVRVAVLIEAATVEPDGATARVRVVRSGLVSSRPEVVRAAHALLESLRSEHRYEIRHGALRQEEGLRALVNDDGSLEVGADPEGLEILRSSLVRAQLRLWTDQLLHELSEPVELADDEALGRWLADTMSVTGILDADALRVAAVRPQGTGYLADPEHVRRLYERVHAPPTSAEPPLWLATPVAPPSPPQPLLARDLDADSLERWVGWKRFVRSVQVVPGTRGNDMDLAFSSDVVRRRLADWFDTAVERGTDRPGDVLLVIAGDGMNPTRDRLSDSWALFESHRRCVLDPNVHYLRIQHAQGTHLSWMKDFLQALHERPVDGHSIGVQFEAEHGASVNVVLVLERDAGHHEPDPTWSLDGWDVMASAVILSDLEASAESRQVALFTARFDPEPGVNQELLHFGRAHCEGLLQQAGARVRAERGAPTTDALERCLVDQIARWIERVRTWRQTSHSAPRDIDDRGRWVARRLGLVDARLARALALEMERTTPASEAAARLWASVPPWPGTALQEPEDAPR